ncbi:MAG TPA: hypothetical protein V6D47_15005 [Oscillatoriaceae cyanobacterium]
MPVQSPRRKATGSKSKRRRSSRDGGLDIFHVLAASFGAFSGLALYSWITPGYVPPAHVATAASVKDLYVTRIKGTRGADGLFTISGQVYNSKALSCKLAKVRLCFYDAHDRLVNQTDTLVENIAGQAEKPFSARAFVAGAVRYEVAVDLADYY